MRHAGPSPAVSGATTGIEGRSTTTSRSASWERLGVIRSSLEAQDASGSPSASPLAACSDFLEYPNGDVAEGSLTVR
jgi:hypothetical protein